MQPHKFFSVTTSKKLQVLLASFVLGLCVAAEGQGKFGFRNHSTSLVYDAQGNPLNDPVYLVELYGGATVSALTPARDWSSGVRDMVRVQHGFFGPKDVVIFDAPGGWAWLQVRAWDSSLGATYEDVSARGIGGYGESNTFYGHGPDPGDILAIPAELTGLQSFSVRAVVPEPGTVSLLVLGCVGLGFRFICRRGRG